MPNYNKLVRDRIPEIIASTGKEFSTRILGKEEYIKELKKKFQEELNEYLDAKNQKDAVEELADVMEIIHTLAEYHEASIEEIERVRHKKAEAHGRFMKGIFLIKVENY